MYIDGAAYTYIFLRDFSFWQKKSGDIVNAINLKNVNNKMISLILGIIYETSTYCKFIKNID